MLWRGSPAMDICAVDPLLKLLAEDASLTPTQLASLTGDTEAGVRSRIKELIASGWLLGYRAVLNEEKLGPEVVRAVIEVRITPERGGGFDQLAERIARHAEVRSCHLMSGGYDLLVEVEGSNLREVASFVSEKLATLQGVLSTATHFVLRAYKEQGVLLRGAAAENRLAVTP
jgi:DNA-binding Lrp family transcriptional regulator